jgi:ClpP class serine protease
MMEAKSALAAQHLTATRWGSDYDIVDVKELNTFYQEQNAMDSDELADLNERRAAQASKANQKAVMTPQGQYPSIKDAAAALNITGGQLRYKMKMEPKEYYFI